MSKLQLLGYGSLERNAFIIYKHVKQIIPLEQTRYCGEFKDIRLLKEFELISISKT